MSVGHTGRVTKPARLGVSCLCGRAAAARVGARFVRKQNKEEEEEQEQEVGVMVDKDKVSISWKRRVMKAAWVVPGAI